MENNYLGIAEIVFKDLRHLSRIEKNIFETLYYNRSDECDSFENTLENIFKTANNILITGDAGVGKSSFVHKIVMDSELMKKHNIYPIVVDYCSSTKRTIESCLLGFIDAIDCYFTEIEKRPINNLLEKIGSNNKDNMNRIKKHIAKLKKGEIQNHLLIFIDDLDYLDDKWFLLLEEFFTFASDGGSSIVLTARPNLLAAIKNYDDRFSLYFSRDVERIHLSPLQAQNVLMTRLAPILLQKATHPFYAFIANLFSRTNPMINLLQKQGISNLSELEKINYPFTKKHNSFMRKITNGCMREIFDIAYESLKYIFEHKNLKKRVEEGIERTVIGIDGMLEMLYKNKDSCYKIINLHKNKSKKGNSLLFNVLEHIKIHPQRDEEFYDVLQGFGHSSNDVGWAINFLNDRANRLIQYTQILPEKRKRELYKYDELEITQKGNYYLALAKYEEYSKCCGKWGRSVIDEVRSRA